MPLNSITITENIHWVGALNPKLRIFDIIMRTEQGTTYNAYLVQGAQKTALIDTVKAGHAEEMFTRIARIMPLDQIDYIVCNHLEPDHSGSILPALERLPKAQIVIAKNGANFLKELTNRDLAPMLVGTGDLLDLGGKTLQFITAPFLHWPDTMFTYCPEDKILFSCDFLGTHYCHDAMFSDQVGDFSHGFRYYYDHIMRPFKEYVLKGLDAIKDLELKVVCTSHGPMLNKDIETYLDRYRNWSSQPEPSKQGKLLIFYVSAYGLTGRLAQEIAEGARQAGVQTALFDLVGTELPDILTEMEAADGLAVGSCTINGDAVKPVWDLLSSLATIKLRGKLAVAFGSYGWSGEAVPMLEERMKSLKMKIAAPGVRVKFTPQTEDLTAAHALGQAIAEKIRAAKGVPVK